MKELDQTEKDTWRAMAETFILQAAESGMFCTIVLLGKNYSLVARSHKTEDYWDAMRTLFNAYEKAEREGRCESATICQEKPN